MRGWGRVVWGVIAVLCGVAAAGAGAYTPVLSPGLDCAIGAPDQGTLTISATQLTPPTAVAGKPFTFSVASTVAPTFAVASSQALLATPDIGGGPGVATATGSGQYSFTVTPPAPGTVYWSVTETIPAAANCPTVTASTGPLTLSVSQAPVTATVLTASAFSLKRGAVSYRVQCSESCNGVTYFEASALHHGALLREPHFDLKVTPVKIVGAGTEKFSRSYSGALRRTLIKLIHRYGRLQLRLVAKVTDARGNVVQALGSATLGL